ncbi:MAG: NUDIX domain-containing protein [archaeon]
MVKREKPKLGKSSKGEEMHYSVGAVIKKIENGEEKYLLIDRAIPPYGFAGVAGHIDEGERAEESLVREVKEECGLDVVDFKLLFEEERKGNWCSKGCKVHYWYLFECDVKGDVKRSLGETKSIAWFSKDEIKKLKLELVWKYWFEKLGVL